jgi:biotin-(acetyl-CoA carboxylase) ligase
MVALNHKPTSPILALPPAYRLVSLREWGDAHAHACRIAADEGAGTFVWVGRFDVLEFAVVLEPEESLASARRSVFAGMAAMADALASFAPPEKPLTFTWPTTVSFNGGRLGGGRLAWPEGCAEDEVPAWLVFSGILLAAPAGDVAPGNHLEATWLSEEGFDPEEVREVVPSFARHLMMAFDTWAERGFAAVAESYLARLARASGDGRRGIDSNGDLLVHREDGVERVPLLSSLVEVAWLDPATGLPRL